LAAPDGSVASASTRICGRSQHTFDPVAGAAPLAELRVTRATLPAFFFAGPGGLEWLGEFGEKVIHTGGH